MLARVYKIVSVYLCEHRCSHDSQNVFPVGKRDWS